MKPPVHNATVPTERKNEAMAITKTAATYGVKETSPIPDNYFQDVTSKISKTVDWSTPGLTVTRLRLLSDPGFPFWDVSYCHGSLNGEPVEVALPFHQLPRRGWRSVIVKHAQADGVYAQGLGILANVSTLL